MATNNYWIKSGLINLAQNVFSVLFSFFSFYFLVRVLGKSDYGVWGLFLTTATIIELARNGLTQEAVIRYYSAGSEDDKRKITTSVIYITLCTTLLISIALLFFAPALSRSWDSPVMTKMFYFFLITFFISGILNALSCIEQASLSFTGILYS